MSAVQTRRRFLRRAAALTLAAGWPGLTRRPAGATGATLRIAQWTHFVPAFDEWFDKKFAREWGERNGVAVEVDHIPVHDLRARADAEVAARHGHDIFGFLDAPAGYEDHVAPLTDVVAECERRFGKLAPLGHRSTFNPRSKAYFALVDSWAPAVLHYRTDWWGEVGERPDTWDGVREGVRRIREKLGAVAGFGLAPEPDSNMMLRGLLWAFGAQEQDEAGAVTINSRATVDAVKLMSTIFRESMTADVFMWDPSSNNRMFVWGRASIIENAISAIRTMEKHNPALARKAALAPPAEGPKGRRSAAAVIHCYVIWRFSPQAELARRFLVDLVGASEQALQASEFYNCPAFAGAVKNFSGKLAAEKVAPGRYRLLGEAERWSAWPGYPGYTTPAIEETVQRAVVPRMFARAVRGEQSPEDAVRQAEAEMKRIFARWAR